MPEKLKRDLTEQKMAQLEEKRLAAARAGGDIIACDCTAGGEWGWHSRKGI